MIDLRVHKPMAPNLSIAGPNPDRTPDRRSGLVRMTVVFALLLFACSPARAAHLPPAGIADHAAPGPGFTYTLPPALLAQARSLYYWRTALGFLSPLWGMAVLLAILWLHGAAALRDWAGSIAAKPWRQGFLFLPPLLLLLSLAEVPLAMLAHHISLVYGQSVQGWGSWSIDWLKGLLLDLIVGTLVLSGIFAVVRTSRQWWIWIWLASLPLQLLLVFLVPVVIDPIFNQFEPLTKSDPALVAQLERVIAKTGESIPPSRIYLMRASVKVTGANAYVTGFGASKRVVVWDTAIQKMSPDQILLIFGHELGHYVLRHILQGLVLGSIGSFFFLWAAFHLIRFAVRRYGPSWRVPSVEDWASVVVLLLIFSVLMFVSDPLSNVLSRRIEHQADIFGLEVTHGIVADPARVDAQAFQRMGEQSLDYPWPNRFVVFWSYTHPTTAERESFAAQYDPWLPGRRPEFFTREGRLRPRHFFSIFYSESTDTVMW